MKITTQVANAAQAGSGRRVLWDADVRGFGLRVAASGTKSWVVKYRAEGGRQAPQRLMSLGHYPTVGVAQAREAAKRSLRAPRWAKIRPANEQRNAGSLR